MSSEYWRRIDELFYGALAQPADQREAWLKSRCGDDREMLAAVHELLAADGESETLREDPAMRIVDRSVADLQGLRPASEGESVGPWRIVREIGRGGMGFVFLAERADDEYQRRVALKLIRGFPDRDSLDRLRKERQILAGLDHPNIAAMIDGGTTEQGQPYLVMQYVDGIPIDRWCKERDPSVREVIESMICVCNAVQYAHQNLVIHRDLKPGNVLMTHAGQPMLLDFGIAKLVEPDSADATDVTRGGRYYTPGFAAPEQLSDRPINTVSDVYSLGKLLELLLGIEDEAFRQRAPTDLRAIVAQATADDPRDRYPSAASLRSDLERYLAGEPVEAAAPRLAYRLRKFVARHRVGVSVAVAVLLVTGALVSRVVVEAERSRAAEARAVTEARNANEVLDFVIGMIEAAGPANARGEPVTVLQAVEQASTPEALQDLTEPELRARVLFALGRLYRTLEFQEPAMRLLGESARLARQVGDIEGEIEALAIQGMSAVLAEDPEGARPILQRAVELARSSPDVDPLLLASSLNNQGILFNELGDTDLALDRISEALDIRRAADAPDRTIATSLHNLGEVHDRGGQPGPALEFYEQALALKRTAVGRMHPSYARSLTGVAMTASQLGDYGRSRQALEEQMAIRAELFGEDHPLLWRDYNELGSNFHDMGDFGQAIENYRLAMEYDERAPGGTTRRWLFINNIAAAHRDWGQFDQAEPLFRESIRLRAERFGPDSLTTVRPAHNLASVLLADGRAALARESLAPALDVRRRELGAGHPDTLRSEVLALAVDHSLGLEEEPFPAMREAIEQMIAATDVASTLVLQARTLLGQALIRDNELAAARTELEAVASTLRERLKPDHALAVVRELDLARIDLLQGHVEQASQRLQRHRAALERQFPEDSAYRRQLSCLLTGRAETGCWQSAAN